MRLHRALALAMLAAAGPALANTITDEVSFARNQATEGNPRAGNLANSLNASFDLDDRWSLSAGALLTVESGTAQSSAFGKSNTPVPLFGLGLDYDFSDHFTAGAGFDWSPKSTLYSASPITFRDALGGEVTGALDIKAVNQEGALNLDLGYDTGGESDLEMSFSGGVTLTRFTTTQSVDGVEGPRGTAVTPQQALNYCNAIKNTKRPCPRATVTLLEAAVAAKPTPDTLDFARFSATVTATVWVDTDISLSGDYYAYKDDPTQTGIWSVGATGLMSIGGGVPIAPVRYLVRPDVTQRFGDFSARLWLQGGHYVESAGGTTAGAGLKLQYKFSRAFRMWLTLSGQTDTADDGTSSKSGSVALGGGYRF